MVNMIDTKLSFIMQKLLFVNEASISRHFEIEPLDPAKLIKVNDLKPITNPITFVRNGVPSSDGLLSNEIFGISKVDRSSTFAYIPLDDTFLHPLFYKIWNKIDSKIKHVVHGTKKFIVNNNGELVEDEENGKTGIAFLKNNIDKIKFKETGSNKRSRNIEFLNKYKNFMFIKDMIVIPAYYRDVNTNQGHIGIGDINKLYNNLIISVRALNESVDYGYTLSQATKGRVQEILLSIYSWFADEPQLSKKYGIIRRAVMSKTADYSSRLVLSAPNLNVENMDDMMVDLDHSAVPLASVCANFFPHMIFAVRRFFENEFSGTGYYPVINNGKLTEVKLKDYQIEFSDSRIKKEMERFMHGYSNRFIPIKIPNEENLNVYMKFKGYNTTEEEYTNSEPGSMPLLDRQLTWCDVFFMAALEVTKDKMVLITRFPIDSYFNQFGTKIVVSSTKETEPMVYNGKFIKYYPRIRQEDIGKNTSNKFVDSLNICNLYLKAIMGDYDGDQCSIKSVYSKEANIEILEFTQSKANYISLGGKNIRMNTNEAIQALYNLTLVLPESKLTNPVF